MARGQNINAMVFNRPLLITLDSLQPITDYLASPERVANLKLEKPKEESVLELKDFNSEQDYQNYKLSKLGINPETMTGVLDISGTLVYRQGEMNANCTELVSYESLKNQAESMIDAGAKTLVLKVDSGGGAAFGMFSAANYIKKLAKQNGVRTVAFIDGMSASAAFGISVLADEIIAHPQAQIGSVGVVVALYNDSKMLEDMGVKRQFVFAGDNKIPFDNSTGEFTDKFINDLQASVNKTYKTFVEHIASNRKLSEQVVRDTQASVYDAVDALAIGFIDKIMELEDFEIEYGLKSPKNQSTGYSQYLTDVSPVEKQSLNNNHKETVTMTDKTVEQVVLENVVEQVEQASVATVQDSQLADLQEKLTTLNTDLTAKQEAYEALSVEKGNIEKQLASAQEQVKQLTSQLDAIKLSQLEAERKEKLSAVLGSENEQVPSLLATTMALDDVAFGAIVSALEAKVEKEDAQLNVEAGNSANQDTTPPDYNAALKAQFSKK